MSVEQVDKIDFIGIDKVTGQATLTISDHLDWTDIRGHLRKLQEKLNTYLRFCESGELYQTYPEAKGRRIVFALVAKHAPNSEGRSFLAKARAALEKAGFVLEVSSSGSNEYF